MPNDLARLSGRTGSVIPEPDTPPPAPLAALSDYLQQRVARAGQMTKGPFHAPGGIDQAAGGAAQFGWVDNPQSLEFQVLQLGNPKVAAALERMPARTVYRAADPGLLERNGAAAMTFASDDPWNEPIQQVFKNTGPTLNELVHEALHALYLGRPPIRHVVAAAPGAEAGAKILERLMPDIAMRNEFLGYYGGNQGHAALAAMARRMSREPFTPLAP